MISESHNCVSVNSGSHLSYGFTQSFQIFFFVDIFELEVHQRISKKMH